MQSLVSILTNKSATIYFNIIITSSSDPMCIYNTGIYIVATYLPMCVYMVEVIKIYSRYTVDDVVYYLYIHACCFLPSVHVCPLIMLYFFSVSNVRGANASDLEFLDSLLASRGEKISISWIQVSSDDTACSIFHQFFYPRL